MPKSREAAYKTEITVLEPMLKYLVYLIFLNYKSNTFIKKKNKLESTDNAEKKKSKFSCITTTINILTYFSSYLNIVKHLLDLRIFFVFGDFPM